jgi:hypothetical protein
MNQEENEKERDARNDALIQNEVAETDRNSYDEYFEGSCGVCGAQNVIVHCIDSGQSCERCNW